MASEPSGLMMEPVANHIIIKYAGILEQPVFCLPPAGAPAIHSGGAKAVTGSRRQHTVEHTAHVN